MTENAVLDAPATGRRRRSPSPRSVLIVASFGAFLALLDSTIVNIAFPSIQSSFPGATLPTLSWVLNGYNIVFAAVLVVGGQLADLIGRRRVFMAGVVVFTIASAACGLANSAGVLIAFRLVQGLGAALVLPTALGLVAQAFPSSRRSHAIGLFSASGALASALGPPIGGALVALWSWRLVFVVNVPLGIATILVARQVLVESRASGRRRVPDLRGAALLVISLGLLTLGVVQGPTWGWTSVGVLAALIFSVVTAIGCVWSSVQHRFPILDHALLRQRAFAVANTATLVASAGWYAYMLAHVLWLRYVWHYSLLDAGLALAPGAAVAAVVAAILGRITDRHGHRIAVALGAATWALALGWWYPLHVGTHPDFLGSWLPGQLITGVGSGATMPMLAAAAMSHVPGRRYATGSAVTSSARQLGAVLGVAALVAIVGSPARSASYAGLIRDGWRFAALCFVVAGLIAVFMGRTTAKALGLRRDSTSVGGLPPVDVAPLPPPRREVHLAETADPSDASMFNGVDAEGLARLEALTEAVEVAAGEWLFHEGDPADAMYVVRTGRLEIVVGGRVVRRIGRGEVIGELALLTAGRRSAGVRALRDTVLGRLSDAAFRDVAAAEPAFLLQVARTVATRLQSVAPAPLADVPPTVLAVVGVGGDAPADEVARALVDELGRYLDVELVGRLSAEELERAEAQHDRLVLVASSSDGPWREFCLRSADRTVLELGSSSPVPETAANLTGGHLVWVDHPPTRAEVVAAFDNFAPLSAHRVRTGALPAGLRPLAARLTGRSVGLALTGGGARAFAHLGVLEVLEQAGIEIDRIAGTSAGAIVAGAWALGYDSAGVDACVYDEFVRRNPMRDYTMPVHGLITGRRLQTALERQFGDTLIEELPREFRCVSVDLLAKEAFIHRRGRLSDAVLASVRMPGIFPPLRMSDRLHVDGTVLDHLPVDALADRDDGPIIGVDVGLGAIGRRPLDPPRMPTLAETLMRTALLGSAGSIRGGRARADLVISPDVGGVGMFEWHEIDTARDAGRRAAEEALPALAAIVARAASQATAQRRPWELSDVRLDS
jgi:NTE family protein